MVVVQTRLVRTINLEGLESVTIEERRFGNWNAAAAFIDNFFRQSDVADFEKLNIICFEDVRRVAPGRV